MKVRYKEKIGSYVIIRFIADAPVDVEETKRKIADMITPEMTEEDAQQLYMDNLIYAKVGDEGELIDDHLGEQDQKKLDEAGEHRLLLESGEYISDYLGTEYWIKKSGKWLQERIEGIGIALPKGAVLQEDIAAWQQAEISAQQEAERIAALPPGEKEEEKKARLHALAREAIQKAEEAELLEEAFDKLSWLKPKRAEVEALYA